MRNISEIFLLPLFIGGHLGVPMAAQEFGSRKTVLYIKYHILNIAYNILLYITCYTLHTTYYIRYLFLYSIFYF